MFKIVENILGIYLTISYIPNIMFKIVKDILGIYATISYIPSNIFKIVKRTLWIFTISKILFPRSLFITSKKIFAIFF